MSSDEQLNCVCSSRKGGQHHLGQYSVQFFVFFCVLDLLTMFPLVVWGVAGFVSFGCGFFLFCSLKNKTKQNQTTNQKQWTKVLTIPLLWHKDSLRDCHVCDHKMPFLLGHAVENLLASKFSLSSTLAILVLLPLGSVQPAYIITEFEAFLSVLIHKETITIFILTESKS